MIRVRQNDASNFGWISMLENDTMINRDLPLPRRGLDYVFERRIIPSRRYGQQSLVKRMAMLIVSLFNWSETQWRPSADMEAPALLRKMFAISSPYRAPVAHQHGSRETLYVHAFVQMVSVLWLRDMVTDRCRQREQRCSFKLASDVATVRAV